MRVKLKWVNRNNRPVSTKIYRTEAIVANDQLGPPLVTLDGDVLEWIDTTVVYGKTYYYVFGVVGGPSELYSTPLKIEAVYSTGPGPTKLQNGDQQLGYFGQATSLEMFTASELQLACGYPQVAVPVPLTVWDKWYRNGKILFVPRYSCGDAASWSWFYNNGLVFGTDDAGAWRPSGFAPVNQMKIVAKGFNRFIVRLPTGADDRNNPTRFVPDAAPVSIRKYSETADLHYPTLSQWFATSQRYPRISSVATSLANLTGSRNVICQEQYKTGCLLGLPSSATNSATLEALSDYLVSNSRGWKPTLEFIQSDFVIGEVAL